MIGKQIKSVFICHTPLHVLIAREIIDLKKISDYIFIYMVENKSEKNLYYYSLLEKGAKKSLLVHKAGKIFDFIKFAPSFIRLFHKRSQRFDSYSGNIKTFYSRYVLFFMRRNAIFSFDDGIGNIKVEGFESSYFLDAGEKKLSRIFFGIFDRSLIYKNLIGRIERHYTIYKYPNVYKNASYLSLFNETGTVTGSGTPLTVLLTNALAIDKFMSKSEETELYDRLVKQYNVDLVIRHPRNEEYIPPSSCTVATSLEIAEHQIVKLIKSHKLFVISFYYSSVLISIPSEIEKINIITKKISNDYPQLRTLYDQLGIPTLEV